MSDKHMAAPSVEGQTQDINENISQRNRTASNWRLVFLGSITFALLALVVIFMTVVTEAFGTIAIESTVSESEITDTPLNELDEPGLAAILVENVRENRLRVIIRDNIIGEGIDPAVLGSTPLSQVAPNATFDEGIGDLVLSDLEPEQLQSVLVSNLSADNLRELVRIEVLEEEVVASWSLTTTLFNYPSIVAERDEDHPEARLEFKSWLTPTFLTTPMASDPINAGIRTALLGTMWMIIFVILVAFPIGIGAAIYLEEYASDNWLNNLIETNIRNLAGVPSIIYGMLGLAVFVRVLGDQAGITNGAFLGITDTNGRTILSAALTMALLILPVVIINAQEAVRAVPRSIREASYGVGATKWQTIWRQVLPAAIPGILTGVILSMSRAVGETAPLIVVGASTFIAIDPNGPFSKFTALPIQIYNWTARPQAEFRDIAAAAILVLLVLLLTLNGAAIILRQRFSRRLQG